MDANAKSLGQHWGEMITQKSPQWKKATIQTYNKTWNVVLSKYWKDLFPQAVSNSDVLAFKNWYLTAFPSRESSKVKIHLKVLFDHLKAIGVMPDPPDLKPLSDLVKITHRNSRRERVGRALSRSEVDRLRDAAMFYPVDWAGAVVLICLNTGMRKSEILDRDRLQVNMSSNLLKVWSQKNSKWREIPLKHVINDLIGSKCSNYLTKSEVPAILQDFTSSAFQKHWVKIKKSAGISGRLRFHDLRHTFASRTAELNWPPVSACDILDMSLSVYQRIYAKPSLESKRELFSNF